MKYISRIISKLKPNIWGKMEKKTYGKKSSKEMKLDGAILVSMLIV